MATEELEVVISPEGKVSVTAKGFTGTSCLTATAELERALGGEILERKMTDDAFRPVQSAQTDQANIGGRRSW